MSRFHFYDWKTQWKYLCQHHKITPESIDKFLWHPEEPSFYRVIFCVMIRAGLWNPIWGTWLLRNDFSAWCAHVPQTNIFDKMTIFQITSSVRSWVPNFKAELSKWERGRVSNRPRLHNPTRWVRWLLPCGQCFCVQEAGGLRPANETWPVALLAGLLRPMRFFQGTNISHPPWNSPSGVGPTQIVEGP